MTILIVFFALVLTIINLYLHFNGDDTLNTPIQLLVVFLLVIALFQGLSGGGRKKDKESKKDM